MPRGLLVGPMRTTDRETVTVSKLRAIRNLIVRLPAVTLSMPLDSLETQEGVAMAKVKSKHGRAGYVFFK